MEQKLQATAEVKGREIEVIREVHAPRDLVFEVWTKPEHLQHWWGPNGFTITTHSMDMTQGGRWEFVMHGPDGTDYDNVITYRKIEPPERIEFLHGDGKGDPERDFYQEILFEEIEGGTRVSMRALLPSVEELERVIHDHNAVEGGKQTLNRMAEYVSSRN